VNPAAKAPSKVMALLPAWNAAGFIAPVLDALAAQTHPDFHVLISDDASTDRTAEICAEFATRHPNFRLIRQPRNLGWVGNVNALLREADADYCFFAFHDDVPRPCYAERLAAALDGNPRTTVAFSDMAQHFPPGTRPDGLQLYLDLEGVTDRVERGLHVARKWGKPPSYIVTLANRGLFRLDAARRVGGLRRHAGGEFGADWPWLMHLALLGEFVRVPEPLITKHYRAGSVSARWTYSMWDRVGLILSCMRQVRLAGLPWREELRIQRALVEYALKRQWWLTYHSGRRLLASRPAAS
jgi:glycosyltransferase involved in cell wall biosynthesis